MPTITGRTKLPGGTTPLVGTWYVRIRTIGNAATDPDGTVRGGIEPATDTGDGATMTLPTGGYEARFESLTRNPDTGAKDQYGWFPFDLTANTTWGVIMTTPVEIPVTPADVTRAEDAADRAEQYASDAAAVTGIVRADPAFAAIRTALDGGRSAAIWGSGDSTLDSSAGDGNRMLDHLATDLATTYPNFRVVKYNRDGGTDAWKAPTVVQAGPTGPRYAQFSARSMRYLSTAAPQFSSNVDMSLLVAPDDWTPAGYNTLICRTRKGASTYSNDLQVAFHLRPDGKLSFQWSTNGTSWATEVASTVALSGVTDGAYSWVRVQFEPSTSGSYAVRFYTSPPEDGVVWTQVGTTQTAAFPQTLWTVASDAFFEIGAQLWQPASTPLVGKIREVRIRNGIDGPMMVPALPELWERYGDPSTTFGGSPTLTILNAARSGSAMTYHTDTTRLPKETPDYGQSALIFCDSHNESGLSGPVSWINPYDAWVSAVQARLPNAAVVVTKQNPHQPGWSNEASFGPAHLIRLDELARLAARRGWSVLDVYSAFVNDPRGLNALVVANDIHPTAAGYRLMGDVLRAAVGR